MSAGRQSSGSPSQFLKAKTMSFLLCSVCSFLFLFTLNRRAFYYRVKLLFTETQVPIVRKMDNAIHWIKLYPVDNTIDFPNTYPLDSDLSGG